MVDFIEAGTGETVVLIHSSVAGAKQWRSLMSDLVGTYRAVAINLFGYGDTPSWPGLAEQSLDDQAALMDPLLSSDGRSISIVGHSFGGSVAMKAAARLGDRVRRLVLIEPNPFYLLDQNGRAAAYAESVHLRDAIKVHGGQGDWNAAAEIFANYWTGRGSWDAMPEDRRAKFAHALKPNFHEWDAVMNEATPLAEWAHALPTDTTVLCADDTVHAIAEIVSLFRAVMPTWQFETVAAGGHMAPLTHPDVVNPLILKALEA